MDDRLGRRDRHDDVRVQQSPVDPDQVFAVGDLDEPLALDVVHFDAAPEPACDLGRDEDLELAMCRAARESSGDEERLAVRGGARALELEHRRRDRRPPRVVGRTGNRERGRFDDDRRAGAPRHERLERLAGEWEAKRVADGSRHVCDRVDRRRRREHDRVLAGVDDCEPRAVRQREPGQGIER